MSLTALGVALLRFLTVRLPSFVKGVGFWVLLITHCGFEPSITGVTLEDAADCGVKFSAYTS